MKRAAALPLMLVLLAAVRPAGTQEATDDNLFIVVPRNDGPPLLLQLKY